MLQFFSPTKMYEFEKKIHVLKQWLKIFKNSQKSKIILNQLSEILERLSKIGVQSAENALSTIQLCQPNCNSIERTVSKLKNDNESRNFLISQQNKIEKIHLENHLGYANTAKTSFHGKIILITYYYYYFYYYPCCITSSC